MRIIYAGTPEFAVPALQKLHADGHDIALVLTQPDRPAGRGRKLQASPVKRAAMALNLEIMQPESLKSTDIQDQLEDLNPDLMVVTAYGLLLPQAVLDIPRHGCWNIHASILPRWRGAAPIQRAIETGDEVTGNSIMQMEAGLDTGPVIANSRLPITMEDTAASLHDQLAQDGADILLKCLDTLEKHGKITAKSQDNSQAIYADKLNKAEAELNFEYPADVLERRIRAFNPWPVCWTELNGKRTRILSATVMPHLHLAPGAVTVSENHLIIGCSKGALAINKLQPAGSKPMTTKAWLNAHGKDLQQQTTPSD